MFFYCASDITSSESGCQWQCLSASGSDFKRHLKEIIDATEEKTVSDWLQADWVD